MNCFEWQADKEFHNIYLSIYNSHKTFPDIFTIQRCCVIMTALMGTHKWSWNVIGVTNEALSQLEKNDFKLKSGHGITRGHIFPRIETCKLLFLNERPFESNGLIEIWLKNDKVILCARGENKANLPKYLPIDNESCNLFPSKSVGWTHGNDERKCLKSLASSLINP